IGAPLWLRTAGHGFEEDIFQRVSTVVHAADLHIMRRSGAIDLSKINIVWQHNANAASAKAGAFAAQPAYRLKKTVALLYFQFQELQVGLALFFKIAKRGYPA